MSSKETVFSKDLKQKKITVTRAFDAPSEQVWSAWTESEILDQWWAPKPYRAETKTMDFREGGLWLYCMAGPDGDRSWCRVDFQTITLYKSITSIAAFCDEAGNLTGDFPKMEWLQQFHQTETGTSVIVEIHFDEESGLEKLIQMGFQEGFAAGLGNLDHYLETK